MKDRRSGMRHALIRWFFLGMLILPVLPAPELAVGQDTDCASDHEPNNIEAEAEAVAGEFCIAGDLPEAADQDLFVWTVSDDDAKFLWSLTVSGPAGTVTSAKIFDLASEPGVEPILAGSMIGEVGITSDSTEPARATFLIAPGQYLVGISRTDTIDFLLPATTGYVMSFARDGRLPKRLAKEPNDDSTTAVATAGEFETAGDLKGSYDTYAWAVSDQDAEAGWEFHVQGALGQVDTLAIRREDGTELLRAYANTQNRIDLFDLVFDPGTYIVELSPVSEFASPYLLRTVPTEQPQTDLEPNDSPETANTLNMDDPVVRGRLASETDNDLYRFEVDDSLAGSMFDVRLVSRSSLIRKICLISIETGMDLQCKEAAGGVSMADILLPRGFFLIRVYGEVDPNDEYILRLDVTTPPSPDYETEPNDVEEIASALDPAVPLRGRLDGTEQDVFRFTVTGEPQLWDLVASGSNIGQFDYSRRDGTELATGEVSQDFTSARITDLYLTRGDHWMRLYGTDSEYTITAVPLGPPPEDGEHESNNQVLFAEPVLVGETKTGRLVQSTDADYFRFSLAAREHITLRIAPPDDGLISFGLSWGGTTIANGSSPEAGRATTLDLFLEAGDYVLNLYPDQVSEGRYSFKTTRKDPFAVGEDQEPNDTPKSAMSLAQGETKSGSVSADDAHDLYLIAADDDRDLTFSVDSQSVYLSLWDGQGGYYALALSADGATYTVDQRVPDDVPLYLDISGDGNYEITYGSEVSGGSGGGITDLFGGDSESTLEATLAVDVAEVAAYWEQSQSVQGSLTLSNIGETDQTVSLDSATSHFKWTVELDVVEAELEAGSSVTIPLTIRIEQDAWGGIPVRLTVAAITEGTGSVTAFVEITPTAEAPPMNPVFTWPVHDSMLGGLDLAAPEIGGTIVPSVDAEKEALLHDGVAPIGSGFLVSGPVLPLALTVDLAGDEPAPIAGIILNPQTFDGVPEEQVRAFQLQLSVDGITWELALTGELASTVRDQEFALPEPVEASFAQLVIVSTYADNPTTPSYVSLGEWSVIAAPGYQPESIDRLNIGDWTAGGHVVRSSPQMESFDYGIALLSPDLTNISQHRGETGEFELVIGFEENRAALLTDLAWVDPDESAPDLRLNSVEIEVSIGTSSGPWQRTGTWELTRADDGSVDLFTFDDPIWARYVRFSTSIAEETQYVEYPAQILIYEAPTGDDYRSVTGAWGQFSPASYYEVENPPASSAVSDNQDAPDDQSQAAEIDLGETITGRAQIGKDVDWYRVTAPEDDNTLSFTLTGSPTVDVTVRVFHDSGGEVDVNREISGDTSTVIYKATVNPGNDYLIEIQQPPHSIVFTFDTSASIGAYQPLVYQSLRSFANGVEKEQEFVQVMAFDEDPLLETWSDDSYLVYSAINGYYDRSLSSSVETVILDSTTILADQEGTTAILIISDAETSSYTESLKMWGQLDIVHPRIFAVHVAGAGTPIFNEHLMEDLSTGGGFYQYTVSQAEMDRAFDRAATWLRRPAGYELTVESSFEEEATPTPEPTAEPVEPATLSVVSPEGTTDEPVGQVSDQVTVEIILDTSGSMLAGMADGQRRIDVAQNVLTDLINNQLPLGVPVTVRVFGDQPDSCDASLLVPLQPLDPAALTQIIQAIEPVNLVRTPIGASLEQVANDLAGVTGPKMVVLVTDGEETCDGDAAAAIRSLAEQGIEVQVNIVGFALDDDALRAQFSEWAELGNGSYFDATNAEELDEAVAKAFRAPYRVLDADGNVVASGTVDGNPVDLPPGTYSVVVLTDPEQRFENVVVEPGGSIKVELASP